MLLVFSYLQEKGNIAAAEMFRTFNMGIGMMAIVPESSVEELLHQFKAHGKEPYLIGEIRAAAGGSAGGGLDRAPGEKKAQKPRRGSPPSFGFFLCVTCVLQSG